MYWKLTTTPCERGTGEALPTLAGRFAIDRHSGPGMPFLDLRLEGEEALHGWRVDAATLLGETWAAEKAPHSKRWLDRPAGATRIDSGHYVIESLSEDEAQLRLEGERESVRICAERLPEIPANVLRGILESVRTANSTVEHAARLIADGATARTRTIARLCGLGRELDGNAFDEALWRKSLRELSLEEIHAQLRSFEVRFDLKFPAAPVSHPEHLPENTNGRAAQAMTILRG